jgi:hypothetical protein
LTSSALGFELGPILRLQDGRAFVIGANNHTALYDPSTNTWAAGPDTPSGFGADDAPAAETPNGHIVYAADNIPAGLFKPPTKIFEFNPVAGTTVEITPPGDPQLLSIPSFVTRMLTLPTGQVLFADSSAQLWVYTGDGGPNPALRPVVNNVAYNGGGIFTLTGKQLNGQSAGAGYGDGGAALQTVNFTLNPAVTAGNYALTVVGAGIPSFPVFVNITQNEVNGI